MAHFTVSRESGTRVVAGERAFKFRELSVLSRSEKYTLAPHSSQLSRSRAAAVSLTQRFFLTNLLGEDSLRISGYKVSHPTAIAKPCSYRVNVDRIHHDVLATTFLAILTRLPACLERDCYVFLSTWLFIVLINEST